MLIVPDGLRYRKMPNPAPGRRNVTIKCGKFKYAIRESGDKNADKY